MATTTLSAIHDRFRAVLEADTLALLPARDAFSHDRQPNGLLDRAYCLVDDGVVAQRPLTNYKAARLDRVTVYVARTLKFAPTAVLTDLHDALATIERAIKADGPAHAYHADLAVRRVTRPEGTDLAVASLGFNVDFDYDEAVQ